MSGSQWGKHGETKLEAAEWIKFRVRLRLEWNSWHACSVVHKGGIPEIVEQVEDAACSILRRGYRWRWPTMCVMQSHLNRMLGELYSSASASHALYYSIDDEDSRTNRRKQFLKSESSSKMVHRILKIVFTMEIWVSQRNQFNERQRIQYMWQNEKNVEKRRRKTLLVHNRLLEIRLSLLTL